MQNIKTEHLVEKARQKDPDAFTELMQLHLKDMYRTALAILRNDEDAADAIQDTILACWEKLGALKKTQYFKTWMTRILINHCYKIRKAAGATGTLEEYEEAERGDEALCPEMLVIRPENVNWGQRSLYRELEGQGMV